MNTTLGYKLYILLDISSTIIQGHFTYSFYELWLIVNILDNYYDCTLTIILLTVTTFELF